MEECNLRQCGVPGAHDEDSTEIDVANSIVDSVTGCARADLS